jgi:hypothetical protein
LRRYGNTTAEHDSVPHHANDRSVGASSSSIPERPNEPTLLLLNISSVMCPKCRILRCTSSQQDVTDILRILGEMRQELRGSRQEVEDLKKEVTELKEEVATSTNGTTGAESLKTAVDQLRDVQEVVQSQVRTLEQTKVGTGSKYSLRLRGMILLKSFAVDGGVDNLPCR